jgi:RNA polymerase sigma-70 factor (ECF subfamily)
VSEADAADDRELVEGYLRGRDEAAFQALYRRHTPAMLGLAARLSGGRGREAEELVQEAWVRAAGSLASFRWGSRVATWLSGFVVNVWREGRRAAGREPLFEGAAMEPASPAPFAPVERLDLERALAALPDGFRAAIVLHDIEGFTHEEIAGQLGIEPGTSKSQLARARRALRAHLTAGRTP